MRIQWHGGPGNIFSAEGLTMAPGAIADVDDELAERLLANPFMSRADEKMDNPLAFPTADAVGAGGLQPGYPPETPDDTQPSNLTVGAGGDAGAEEKKSTSERHRASERQEKE